MKAKFTLLLMLFLLSVTSYTGGTAFAQTVAGAPSTTGCKNMGIVTASSTGLGATPQYQLLKAGLVVAPVDGDAAQFTNTAIFTGLSSGSYTVKARATSGGTVYTSANITVNDGYTDMVVISPTQTTPCASGTVALTTNLTGGKAPFEYCIKDAGGTILETSAPTAAVTFTYGALPVGNYLVCVTDSCGNTVTSATSISQSGALIDEITPESASGLVVGRTNAGGTCATSKIVLRAFYGLRYVSGGGVASATDKTYFTWRLEFNGQSYGQDINADGNPDLAGPNFLGSTNIVTLPGGITDRATALAGNPKYVLYDKCGNSRTFTPGNNNIINLNRTICGSDGKLVIVDSYLGGSAACYPIDYTFTRTTAPFTVINIHQDTPTYIVTDNFVPGATYNITYTDAAGVTSGYLQSNTLTFASTPNPFGLPNSNLSTTVFNSFQTIFSNVYSIPGDVITITVVSSSVPAMVGYSTTVTMTGTGTQNFVPTYPPGYSVWPGGSYTFQLSGSCGTSIINVNRTGYTGVLASLTTAPVCGGFNVTANTTGVNATGTGSAADYEIVIVSGPSNVGATRTLVNATTSQPYNGLAYGTYVFGIRLKGSTVTFNTQTVTYSAANAITIDNNATGGFVCSAGATNGTLTIVANSVSPAPGNVLQYAISLDNGATYGAYQSSNVFSGLTNQTYFFRVMDGCGNEVTGSSQIGVAAAPTASANGTASNATLCASATGTTQLDVDVLGASSYLWTGPGITAANQNIKSPVINTSALATGANNFSVSVTLGAPCNSTSVANLVINVNALPTASISYPTTICQSSGTASVTQTGQTGGTYAATPAGLSINATTGAINPALSTAGTFEVTYSFTNGTCPSTATTNVIITANPTATILYPATPYYATGAATVTQTGQTGGTYTATPAGLSINAATGAVDLSASTPGSYTVTYSFSNGTCSNTTTAPIQVLQPSVSGTPSNTACKNSGVVTASSVGLGATPQYQLWKAGVVVAPVSGDATQFTNTNVFTGLASGTYVVKGRANATGTVFTSGNIVVTDGYNDMAVVTPTQVLTCVGGTAVLTSTVTNGKAPFVYSIATQAAPGTALQTSASTSATSFAFNALPLGTYLVSVTDACGQTVTGATAISNPAGASVNDFKVGSNVYMIYTSARNCSTPMQIFNELGFQYISNSQTISAADAANFTWKIKFQGQLYGQDIDADGYADLGGAGFPSDLLNNRKRMPIIATRDNVVADMANMRIVLSDACGNTKEFPVVPYPAGVYPFNCGGTGQVRIGTTTLVCNPVVFTFTNTANPADVVVVSHNASGPLVFTGFTAGANYNFTYVDAAGYTTGAIQAPASQNITIPTTPAVSVTQNFFGVIPSLNYLDFGILRINVSPYQIGDPISYTVTSSSNPLVAVGYSGSGVVDNFGQLQLPRVNPSHPTGYWPKGIYTLQFTTACGVVSTTFNVPGYTASLTGNTITPVCGGFNYVLNGTFDVQSAYEVVIISGPANVGMVRDLASLTASLPFNGLTPGNYVFGVRIKGGTLFVLTQNVSYTATSVITVDKTQTGGFVCVAGATNGTLTIVASSASPAPGDVLEYAISLDGGTTYGAYQSSNVFTGLTNGTYFYKVKDGCGNIITESAQIGVAASPTASANGSASAPTVCNDATGTVQLDVDVTGASSYLWTGPGITAANQGIKNPQVNISAMSVGTNNYSVTVTLGAPCNTSTVATISVNVAALPTVVTTAPAAVCFPNTADITAAAVTAGSAAGLTYTYFSDAAGTTPLANANAVAVSGTYYIKGSNGSCSDIKPVTVTINPLPVASISYPNGPYCNRGTATVTQTGVAGGTYSSTAGLSINPTTGAIDLAASTPATYTVTYAFSNGTCSSATTASITINATKLPTALAPVAAECSATLTAPTLVDPCSGVLTATTTTVFPITASGLTVVTWTFNYGNGVIQTVDQNVTITPLTTPTVSVGQQTCTVSSGTITVTAPVSAGYEYSIDGVNYQSSTGFTGLAQGNYSVTVKNTATGCISAPRAVTIGAPLTPIAQVGTATTTCASSGMSYTVTVEVAGTAPFTATGTGTPGTFAGNIWTSDAIAAGTDYSIDFQDANACNTLTVAAIAPTCCVFEVTCPTFAPTTIACYAAMPTATTLTEAQFEALGNGDGMIGNIPCGVIEITASNAASPACEGVVVRTYTITEYADTNNNDVRDSGENTVLNSTTCTQNFTIERLDFTMPANGASTVACAANITAPTVPVVTDNCGNVLTASAPVISAAPACEGNVTYTYAFTDCEGNTHNWVYTYTIERLDFSMPANGASTVACAANIVAPTVPVVTDNCGNVLTASAPVISAAPACEGNVTYTYAFTDCEGNTHNWVYTYTIERLDFTMPANGASTVACVANIVAPTVPVVTDNCGNVLTASAPVISAAPACEGNVTYTYAFTDCEGNTHNWVYTYTIERLDFTMPANGASTVACASAITAPTVPVVTDNCGNVLTASAPVISAAPACEGNVTYTYAFTDCEGNTHNWVYTYTIERLDFTMPANGASTVACASAITAPTVPVVTDNCGNVLTASAPVISAAPACEGNVTYTYAFTDCEGNTHNWVYTYTIERLDFSMPANGASTVACASAITAPTVPVVTDNCGNVLTASAPVISAAPACEGNVTYTYAFTDCEGNTHNWVYTYTIERLDFSMPANGASTVACASAITAPTVPVVTDNCGNVLTASAPVISAAPACEGNVTYTYAFTDCEGNTHNWVYTYTIERLDFSMPANGASTVACASAITAPTVPVVTDNCGNVLTASAPVISAAPACEGNVTYTYAFTDCEGNTHNWVYTYTIERLDFTMPANGASTVACASAITAPTVPVVTDNCGNVLTASAPVISAAPACEGNVTYTYAFTDCEGNTHNWVYTYTIERLDFSMPANGASTVACASAITAPTVPVVTDNCGNVLTASAPVISAAPACEGNVTYTYAFTDCEGNTHNWVYTYTIERLDFSMPANGASTVACASAITAPTVPVVTDNCGNVLTASTPVISAAPACEGNVTYTYAFTDCEGNTHNWVYTYTIERLDFSMPANGASTVACASAITAPTVPVVTDNCGNVLVASAPVISAAPACEGDVTYTYAFTDCEGNTHNWVYTYTIERLDFSMPANGAVTVQCISEVVAPTVPVITDNCGNTLTASAPIVTAMPTCEGNVTYTYTFTDCEGNTHDWVYIYTVDDVTVPTGTAPANITLQCIDDVPVADVNAITDESDNCNGAVSVTVSDVNNGGTGCASSPYIVTRTYTLTDCSGLSTNLVQTITVEDTAAPAFAEALPQDAIFSCDAQIPAAATLTATDNCSAATVAFDEQVVNAGCIGNYDIVRTWTATDACGNETVHVQTIMVEDTTAPTFVEELPGDTFAECDKLPAAPILTAVDNCGTATVSYTEVESDGDCSLRKVVTRTWTATDDCGNTAVHTQKIDTACPVVVYNALTPDGDGRNDVFLLEGIDCYPNNSVMVFNRWGVKVFETRGYDNVSKVFSGYSDGRSTVSGDSHLPTGTYFYVLKYEFSLDGINSRTIEKAGYLYINSN